MVPKYVINVSIIWLSDNIYSRNTWFPTTDVQTQNIGKLRYANRRTPTECRYTVATQATEYQRWRDVGCRSRRCRPMPTLGQRRNASWGVSCWLRNHLPCQATERQNIMDRTHTWQKCSVTISEDILTTKYGFIQSQISPLSIENKLDNNNTSTLAGE